MYFALLFVFISGIPLSVYWGIFFICKILIPLNCRLAYDIKKQGMRKKNFIYMFKHLGGLSCGYANLSVFFIPNCLMSLRQVNNWAFFISCSESDTGDHDLSMIKQNRVAILNCLCQRQQLSKKDSVSRTAITPGNLRPQILVIGNKKNYKFY